MTGTNDDDEPLINVEEENENVQDETRIPRELGTLRSPSSLTSWNESAEVAAPKDEDDDEPLYDDSCWLWRRLKNIPWFWAELVFFLYMFCDFPVNLVAQKYVLEWITKYNWNRDLANNITHNFTWENASSSSICNANVSSPEYNFNQRNQMMSSYYNMLRTAVWVCPAILSTLVLGSVSDRHGRKYVFIPPIFAAFIYCVSLIPLVHFNGSIFWLLLLDFGSGLSGSFGCVILAGVAHVVGKTTVKTRLFRLTILQLFLSAGSTVSPFAMGPAYDHLGPTITMAITTAASGLNLFYCLLCLPSVTAPVNSGLVVNSDSLVNSDFYAPEIRDLNDSKEVCERSLEGNAADQLPNNSPQSGAVSPSSGFFNEISEHIKNSCRPYTNGGSLKVRRDAPEVRNDLSINTSSSSSLFPDVVLSGSVELNPSNVCRLRVLICAFFVVVIPYFDYVIMTLFELNSPLCWTPSTIGMYTGVSVAVTAVGSMIVAPLMERFTSHVTVAIVCCIFSVASRVYLFFVRDTTAMFIGTTLNVFNQMLIPCIRTMMTLLVDQDQYGAILGSIAAVEILCCFLASVLFSMVYSATLLISTGFVFLISGAMFGLGTLIFIAYRIKYGTAVVFLTGSLQEMLT